MIRRSTLLDAYRTVGEPRATIYIPTPSAQEDAEQRLEILRKNVSTQLEDLGAASDLVATVEHHLATLEHDDGPGRVLVATAEACVLDGRLERPVSRLAVHHGPTPALLPLLAATQVDVDHLAVLLDRTGADVLLRHGVSDPIDRSEIDGPDVRVHRSHPGGWSQKRFQQTAENAWENNAREIVDAMAEEHPDVDLVVCGGDVRAVGFFTEHLPARYAREVVDASRHADEGAFLDAVDAVLRDRSATAIVELLERWRQARADGSGSSGLDVLADLVAGRVDHLLVVDDTTDPSRPQEPFAFEDPILHAPPARSTTVAPVTDAAVAIAIATGAGVTVVPSTGDVDDGLAAIRRF